MKRIALSKVIDFIPRNRIFAADFIKADGSRRKMIARRGVKRAKGTGSYSHTKDTRRNNLTVWDMAKGAYRAIPLDRVVNLKIDGVTYEVV